MRFIPFTYMSQQTTPVPLIMTINTTAEGNNYVVSLPYYSGGTYSGTIDWGDGNTSGNTYANNAHTYVTAGTYTITITGVVFGFNTFFTTTSGTMKNVLTAITQFGNNFNFGNNDTSKFRGCKILTSVSSDIPLSGVNFRGMFQSCILFNHNISSWDVSVGGTDMGSMFEGSSLANRTIFNQDISSWDMSNKTNINAMFYFCDFNQNINSWNVSNVTQMTQVFQESTYNQPLNSWNVGNVQNMTSMFRSCPFNQNINSWDVSSVTNMSQMFRSSLFNQNIGSWNVSNVTTMANMFLGDTSFTTANLDNIYNGWSALPSLQSNVPFECPPCYNATAGRAVLTGTYNWSITDGGVC